ncbi:MAG: 1-acyl-sn-glycerol-3-phosphate acyltransferase [Chloroflexi bacterium]|nr:1-acyl-sn-glycerol-3-phosphate acyltransferase [Chloroflexota bacterium]
MPGLGARLAVAISRVLYNIFFNWSVTGRENVPQRGALVVVANHVNTADPMLLMCAFPRWMTYMAKEELFHYPFLGALLRSGRVVPVARTGTLQEKRSAMRQAEELLAQGHVLGLFPEGKRDRTGVLLPGKPGAAVLAAHSRAPLIPVAVSGTEQLSGLNYLWKRPTVTVTIGKPFRLSQTGGRISRSRASELADEIMRQIAALLPKEQRGPYAD